MSRDVFGIEFVTALNQFGDGPYVVREYVVLMESQYLQPESDQRLHGVLQPVSAAPEELDRVQADDFQDSQRVRQELVLVRDQEVQQHVRVVCDARQELGEPVERLERRAGGGHGVRHVQRAHQTLDGRVVAIAHEPDQPPGEPHVRRVQPGRLDVRVQTVRHVRYRSGQDGLTVARSAADVNAQRPHRQQRGLLQRPALAAAAVALLAHEVQQPAAGDTPDDLSSQLAGRRRSATQAGTQQSHRVQPQVRVRVDPVQQVLQRCQARVEPIRARRPARGQRRERGLPQPNELDKGRRGRLAVSRGHQCVHDVRPSAVQTVQQQRFRIARTHCSAIAIAFGEAGAKRRPPPRNGVVVGGFEHAREHVNGRRRRRRRRRPPGGQPQQPVDQPRPRGRRGGRSVQHRLGGRAHGRVSDVRVRHRRVRRSQHVQQAFGPRRGRASVRREQRGTRQFHRGTAARRPALSAARVQQQTRRAQTRGDVGRGGRRGARRPQLRAARVRGQPAQAPAAVAGQVPLDRFSFGRTRCSIERRRWSGKKK